MRTPVLFGLAVAVFTSYGISPDGVAGSDWPRFRGPNGSGICTDPEPIPTEWSDSRNLLWKAELPGPGSSSPIVVGDHVFVTSWSGYADGSGTEGTLESLKRHLVCLDRKTGKRRWMSTVNAKLPEETYRGMFAENGYASHTPVSDGEVVVAFFGKSGVYAYDLQGHELWKADAGEELDRRGWGSASSPILYQNQVIVTASVESHSIIAFDRTSGKQLWKQEADGFSGTWGTPILVEEEDGVSIVIGVPYEFWALNPENGRLRWYCESVSANSMCSSVVARNGVLYAVESGPGGGGAVAVRAGGNGDITAVATVWKRTDRSRIDTPVVDGGLLYFVSNGVVSCLDAATGDRVYQARLSGGRGNSADGDNRRRSAGPAGSSTVQPARRSRTGAYGGGQDYSSPIIVDGELIFVRRSGDVYVVKTGREFEQLAVNRFESATGDFHATPAASEGQLFIRGGSSLYCVAAQ